MLNLSARLACFAFIVMSAALACGEDDHNETNSVNRDRENCTKLCETVQTTCPDAATDFLENGVEGCKSTGLDNTDSSSAFRQCNADAKNCDELSACKQKF